MPFSFKHSHPINPDFSKAVGYFCMEYAIHQPLKLYAGGLGFLSGSHLRSAFELRQNVVAVGILWKYGYYDQVRKGDQTMDVLFQEKVYGFLQKTEIRFTIRIWDCDVWVSVYYLPPETFDTAPLFLLSTDNPENDYSVRIISHRLYDSNPEIKLAAGILLGVGGAKLFEMIDWKPEVYHLNESHALPLAFYLYSQYKEIREVRRRVVFTNHTPEAGGNLQTDIYLLEKMGYFSGIPQTEIKALTKSDHSVLNHSLTALQFSGIANAVSRLHLNTMTKMWADGPEICPIIAITNAQNAKYWANTEMYDALKSGNDKELVLRKLKYKRQLFEVVADQNGEIFDTKVLTIVFAKRFAGYKRPDLLLKDMKRFERLITNTSHPIQIIWAGKPYPQDYAAIGVFDHIVHICKQFTNCAILVGYELRLSKVLKRGADVWLNLPRLTHEASGTSGMTAAMNGAINVSIPDGWFPEYARDKENSFVIPAADIQFTDQAQDDLESERLYDLLEKEIIPMYYDHPSRWISIVKKSMNDVIPEFDSNRMVTDYYRQLYEHATL